MAFRFENSQIGKASDYLALITIRAVGCEKAVVAFSIILERSWFIRIARNDLLGWTCNQKCRGNLKK